MITHNDLKICASLAREANNYKESIEQLEALAEFGKLQGGAWDGASALAGFAVHTP